MNGNKQYQGFTLVELMVTVAVIGVLSAIAVPVYNGYIKTTKQATARANADTLAGFEDTYFYENESYLAGVYTPGSNGLAALEWAPSGDQDLYKYEVTTGGCTAPVTQCYTITVTMISDPTITQTISRP